MATETGDVRGRAIGIVFSDGGLLSLSAARPKGASEHGEERVSAVLCDPDGKATEVDEALLSTEYGADGVQRRVTLELWADAEGSYPMRGAGTLLGSARVEREDGVADVAFFRWSVEGREGLGHYEILRDRG